MKYVYVDESIFSAPQIRVGTGILVSNEEISLPLISKALINLAKDPDIQRSDRKELDAATISRGFFHASEDSANAHSHLLNAINSGVNGRFVCDFHDVSKVPVNKFEPYFKKSFVHSMMETMRDKVKVLFFVEGRSSVTMEYINRLCKGLEEGLTRGAYDIPAIPLYFPEFSFEIVKKENPGVQICDFLLWTVNRKVNGDTRWYDRISSRFAITTSVEDASWGGNDLTLGRGLNEPFDGDPYEGVQYERINESSSREELARFLLQAIYTCELYSKFPTPTVSHFQNDIDLIASLKTQLASPDYIEILMHNYLKLFDMVDLVRSASTQDDKLFLLRSKKYCSLALRGDLIHGMNTRQFFVQTKRNILETTPELMAFRFPEDNTEP